MYHLQVLTPEEIIYENEVTALIAPGREGYFGVLTDHAPLIALLKPGILTITDKEEKKHFYKISEGFFEVNKNKASLLVDHAETTAPVDMDSGAI